MNAVFSLISSPKDHNKSINNFLNIRDFVTAMSLSVLCAKQNKMQTVLYSDAKSADMLGNIGVYFDQYDLRLDDKNIHGHWWTMGKVETYGMQMMPFLHIDGDAFVFDRIKEADVICQGLDYKINYYKECVETCKKAGCVFPEYFENYIQQKDYDQFCYNTGIFGGTNNVKIYEYAQSALKFVKDNKGAWEQLKNVKHKSGLFAIQEICVMVEQLFMTAYMQSVQQQVTCVTPGQEIFVTSNLSYVHMVGELKKHPQYLYIMHEKMYVMFPHEYNRILEKYS